MNVVGIGEGTPFNVMVNLIRNNKAAFKAPVPMKSTTASGRRRSCEADVIQSLVSVASSLPDQSEACAMLQSLMEPVVIQLSRSKTNHELQESFSLLVRSVLHFDCILKLPPSEIILQSHLFVV